MIFSELGQCGQLVQAIVGHVDDADVGLDGAKGKIGRLRFARTGYSVEESGLADVGQADDSGFEHRPML